MEAYRGIVALAIGYILGNKKGVLQAGDYADLPRGIAHDWWNAGEEEARVQLPVKRVEVEPLPEWVRIVGV